MVFEKTQEKASLPTLVLMNLNLPQLLGLAVLRRLRMDINTLALPIIAYSRKYDPKEVLLSYQAGATSFVKKPDNIEQFISLLHGRPLLPSFQSTILRVGKDCSHTSGF